nr:dihydropteroate synthase [Angustibacter aerolatus]
MGVVNVTPDSFSDGGRWFEPAAGTAHGREPAGPGRRPARRRRRVDAARCRPPPLEEEPAPGAAGRARPGGRGRPGQHRHHARRGRRAGPPRRGGAGQRRERRARRPGDGAARGPHRRAVRGDALARAVRPHGRPRHLRRRGHRRPRRAWAPGCGRSRTPGSTCPAWSSTRGWASPSAPSTTGRCWPGSTSLAVLHRPLLVGPSRKRFLGSLLAGPDGAPRPPQERDDATAATSVLVALAGAWCVRVHDVPATADAVRVVAAALAAGERHPVTDLDALAAHHGVTR